jgi:hypothetical protein
MKLHHYYSKPSDAHEAPKQNVSALNLYSFWPGLMLILVLLGACASPVYRLEPVEEEEVRWVQGQQILTRYHDGVTVTLSYLRHTSNGVTLDVEIINESEETLHINPSHFFYVSYSVRPDVTEEARLDSRYAYDPESQILEIDKALSRRSAFRKVEVIADITSEFANIAQSLSDLEHQPYMSYTERAVNRSIAARQFDADMSSLEDRRHAWSHLALRRTDLTPDQFVNGFLHIPFDKNARFVEVVIPIGAVDAGFLFRQHRYEAK